MLVIKTKKTIKALTIGAALSILSVGGFFLINKYYFQFIPKKDDFNTACVSQEDLKTVRGDSLQGIISEGEEARILKGYYGCNPVERGDIVVYNFSAHPDPIIKIIKGIPGDKFSLKENSRGGYNILINGEILKTSFGRPYELSQGRQDMLALYEKDYSGIMPKDTFLILGNQPQGTLDSTRFGLISRKGIIGKVLKP